MKTIIRHKWGIAALTLLTLPLSFFGFMHAFETIDPNMLIIVGMFPLILSVTAESLNDIFERMEEYIKTGKIPPSKLEGSYVGNLIALILAVLLVIIFVVPFVLLLLNDLM